MDKKNLVEKKIHEEKAHKIVTRLAVETVDPETLLSIAKYIEPYHYEEIVEERFLSKLCGYPICKNAHKKIPSQKYQISSKLNKVYDIGDRKRYCSAECYKSSKYLETQISSVPIWLRNTSEYLKNDGAKQISLLNSASNSLTNQSKTYHDEYDLKFKTSENKTKNQIKSEFSQINDQVISHNKLLTEEIEKELNGIENQWRTKYQVPKTVPEAKVKDPLARNNIFKHKNVNEVKNVSFSSEIEGKREILDNITEEINSENVANKKFIETTLIHNRPTSLFHIGKIFEISKSSETSSELKIDQLIVDENDENVLSKYYFIEYIINRISDLLSKRTKEYIQEKKSIEKSTIHEERKRMEQLKKFDEYVTETSVLFNNLTNEASAKTVGDSVNEIGDRSSDLRNLNTLKNLDDNGEAEMIAKLELMGINPHETNEKQESNVMIDQLEDNECSKESILKPLPNFNQLRDEAKEQQLKIKEFFIGDPFSEKARKIKELEARQAEEQEMAKDKTAFGKNSFKIKSEEQEIIRVLPTVDSQSQMDIRRKIFFEKLVKYMDQILKFSDYSTGDVQLINHIKNFVFSLKLDNQNMLFNTSEWPIVSLFILKILSLKQTRKSTETDDYNTLSKNLEKLITSNKLIDTILISFKLDQQKFGKICNYLIQ